MQLFAFCTRTKGTAPARASTGFRISCCLQIEVALLLTGLSHVSAQVGKMDVCSCRLLASKSMVVRSEGEDGPKAANVKRTILKVAMNFDVLDNACQEVLGVLSQQSSNMDDRDALADLLLKLGLPSDLSHIDRDDLDQCFGFGAGKQAFSKASAATTHPFLRALFWPRFSTLSTWYGQHALENSTCISIQGGCVLCRQHCACGVAFLTQMPACADGRHINVGNFLAWPMLAEIVDSASRRPALTSVHSWALTQRSFSTMSRAQSRQESESGFGEDVNPWLQKRGRQSSVPAAVSLCAAAFAALDTEKQGVINMKAHLSIIRAALGEGNLDTLRQQLEDAADAQGCLFQAVFARTLLRWAGVLADDESSVPSQGM